MTDTAMPVYSPFFETLYDQPSPVGRLGRGVHYSVLRAVVWSDIHGDPTSTGRFLDFAVVWDEDHDPRVIEVIEAVYFAGLLGPVQVVGERKASMTFLFDPASRLNADGERTAYEAALVKFNPDTDEFFKEVAEPGYSGNLVQSEGARAVRFVDHIRDLHKLGQKPPTPTVLHANEIG